MSDEQDNAADEEPEKTAPTLTGGERLAEARREQQISVLEVAKELHLDEPKVRALERNEFEVLGAPVFAKGHLRKYAELVGVNADDVFADYYQLTRSESVPPIVIGRRTARHEISPGPWIAVIIVIAVVALAYWWFAVRVPSMPAPSAVPETTPEPTAAIRDAPDTEDVIEPTATPPDDTGTETAAPVVDEPAAAVPAAVAESEPDAPADGELRLSITFSGDCWTEITDADGRRLFFDMGRSGRSVELSGRPPLSVLFGNADNVTVRVNDNPYRIPAVDRRNRTARLTIRNP